MTSPKSHSKFVAEMKLESRSPKKLRTSDELWNTNLKKNEKNISVYGDITMQSSRCTIKHPPSGC